MVYEIMYKNSLVNIKLCIYIYTNCSKLCIYIVFSTHLSKKYIFDNIWFSLLYFPSSKLSKYVSLTIIFIILLIFS